MKKKMQTSPKYVLAALLIIFLLAAQLVYAASRNSGKLVLSSQKSGEIYYQITVKPGDELSFGWEHSFEHVEWDEYYEILEDGSFDLHTIAVAGFGAGIPAEMDCTYRYQDGLIYMENIQGSRFSEFNWIHSTTQLKWIAVNGEKFVTGPDLPQRDRINLKFVK